MTPNPIFSSQPKAFWAHVRTLSQHLGYTLPRTDSIYVPDLQAVLQAFNELSLDSSHLIQPDGSLSDVGALLLSYFQHRAEVLDGFVRHQLMDAEDAEALFVKVQRDTGVDMTMPMNKQKGEKKKVAFLTAMVNMLVYKHAEGFSVNFDPRHLTTITQDNKPLRTLARRVDGAFPSVIDPIAIWEIKEYYYTTTFGSRVADGVYETLLDGMELEELRNSEGVNVRHLLIIDSYFTWWRCGRSYLCRIIDMLHMGYVSEVLFGREIVDRLPQLVEEWVVAAHVCGLEPTRTEMPSSVPTETDFDVPE